MNALCQPDFVVQPAALLQIIQRPAAMHLLAEPVFVRGLRQMGVEANAMLRGKLGAGPHQGCRDTEGRAGRQRDLNQGVRSGLVVARDQPFAIGEDRVLILHD